MSDVTEAVAQDQVAESLLGPEPTQNETAEQPQTGTEAVDQAEEFQPTDEEAGLEAQPEEESEDWLPSEQDKTFTDETLLNFANHRGRYSELARLMTDPNVPEPTREQIRALIRDKINGDMEIQYNRQLQEQQEQLQELQPEEPQPEPLQQQIQQTQQAVTFEQHIANMNQWVQQNTDPRVANMFASEFMKAFGVNDAVKPEMAQALTQTFSTFGLNLIQTALPQMLPMMMNQVFPGSTDQIYMSNRAQSWDQVRNSSEDFANLPAYGTKEFMELCAKVDSEFPALTEAGIQLEKAGGGQLYGPAAVKFYSSLAKAAARLDQPIANPQMLLNAAKAGAANARRGQVRKDAGNLGAGQSKGLNNNRAVNSQFQTNQDIFNDDTMAIWAKEHGRI